MTEPVDDEPTIRPGNSASRTIVRKPMFEWLGPLGLVLTGFSSFIALLFARYADKRDAEAMLPEPQVLRRADADEVWVDFVADVGDGFNSTFAIATLLARPELGGIPTHRLPRGDVLVIGGDLVYPTPSPKAYGERFVGPYEAAFPPGGDAGSPTMLAIPGNHDWYDGLSAFLRLMCRGEAIGGWETNQTRSYFAISLPGRWWLWAIDLQLDTFMDEPQRRYFMSLAQTELQTDDKVILVTAKPTWAFKGLEGDEVRTNEEAVSNLVTFEQEVVRANGGDLRLVVSGDLHHYSRYESAAGVQRVTAGGGGAFLYPTHGLPDDLQWQDTPDGAETTYTRACRYPERSVSESYRFGALNVPRNDPRFMWVPRILTLLALWIVYNPLASLFPDGPPRPHEGWLGTWVALLRNPTGLLFTLAIFAGLYLFADGKTHQRLGLSFAHLTVQLACVVTLVWLGSILLATSGNFVTRLAMAILVCSSAFALGGLAGALVMGAYLVLTQRFLGLHPNENFASQHIEDHKGFLRMRIRRDGSLRMYPIKLDRVPRRWEPNLGDGPLLNPVGVDLIAELIEPAVDIVGG